MKSRQEVDLTLEDKEGKIVGIEIKSSETIGGDDFKHFKVLKEEIGNDFVRGVVLYAGHQTLSFGSDLIAMPISAGIKVYPSFLPFSHLLSVQMPLAS